MVKVISQEYNEVFAEYTITQGTRYCICYTSSDGKIVKPQDSSSFDATILSNTYKDGSGIIEFDAPITSIEEIAFAGHRKLTSVTIPDSVTSIGICAFEDCSSLTNVYCKPTTPPAGDYDIFTGNASGRKIYVPTESVEAYKNASHWSDYASDIVGYNFQ